MNSATLVFVSVHAALGVAGAALFIVVLFALMRILNFKPRRKTTRIEAVGIMLVGMSVFIFGLGGPGEDEISLGAGLMAVGLGAILRLVTRQTQ